MPMPKNQEKTYAPMQEDMKEDYKDPSSHKEAKEMLKAEEKQARTEHSKSGANTHEGQGMEYVPRKNHYADVPHNR
ncbi:hypothetical protein CONLIGDRAFT_717371 [Coniochaeta ligniaria NRRL 30616]|uniref:Uncharacterized protein n=1 Tax=Coniochaeta ligniaria NRRL 30616 TaxID=1408157 RepID=A0A1J7JDJ3_9PEZI|nr:hypothetical protein CONLIGDRAFT_717371 [Coniochaeta ligniaria NRRL 30616]